MKFLTSIILLSIVVLGVGRAAGQTQHVSISDPLNQLTKSDYDKFRSHINEVKAEIDDAQGAEQIMASLLRDQNGAEISQLIASSPKNASSPKKKDFYCIIHLLR